MTFPKVSGDVVMASVVSQKPLATDVPGGIAYTNESRSNLHKAMRDGRLPAYKNGTKTVLFYHDLDCYMASLPRAKFKTLKEEAEAEAEDPKLKTVAEERREAETVEGTEAEAESDSSVVAAAEELSATA